MIKSLIHSVFALILLDGCSAQLPMGGVGGKDITRLETVHTCSMKGGIRIIVSNELGSRPSLTLAQISSSDGSHSREASVNISDAEWNSLIHLIEADSILAWKAYSFLSPRYYDGCSQHFRIDGPTWRYGLHFGMFYQSPRSIGLDRFHRQLDRIMDNHYNRLDVYFTNLMERFIHHPHPLSKDDSFDSLYANSDDITSLTIGVSPEDQGSSRLNTYEWLSIFNSEDGYSIRLHYKYDSGEGQYTDNYPISKDEWCSIAELIDQEHLIEWNHVKDDMGSESDSLVTVYLGLGSSGGWSKESYFRGDIQNTIEITRVKNRMIDMLREHDPINLIYLR